MPLSRSLTQPQGTLEYAVTANDTLASIAARFHTTPSELARINRKSGHFVFPGQVLFVPKNHQPGVIINTDNCEHTSEASNEAPPNSPNHDDASSLIRANSIDNSTSSVDSSTISAVPGNAKRVNFSSSTKVENNSHDNVIVLPRNHVHLHQTTSSPLSAFNDPRSPIFSSAKEFPKVSVTSEMKNDEQKHSSTENSSTPIDPADRECLERFLKINVRHITDGQGVVSGVLLVTPNALMFDPNVSDPLVIEHGTEIYGVTVPMELVLKTALYSDIAHMRVKHAPEHTVSVPKPSVYYAMDDEPNCIVEENLRGVYGSKQQASNTFDTITKTESESKVDAIDREENKENRVPPSSSTLDHPNDEINIEVDEDDEEEFKDAFDGEPEKKLESTTPPLPQNSCDENNDLVDVNANFDQSNNSKQIKQSSSHSSSSLINNKKQTGDSSIIPSQNAEPSNETRSSEVPPLDISMDETVPLESETSTSMDQIQSMASIDDLESMSIAMSTPPLSATEPKSYPKLSANHMAKMVLSERHSAPLQSDQQKHKLQKESPHLISAISAEEAITDPTVLKRMSSTGESRREQMLKRLSNPVDAIGNLTKSGFNTGINATKSGFNATKTGISTGLNATKSGISTGIMATKTGLTTGLSVTKTGFNKVLATPKNLMDFSSGLVRDAKGALGTSTSVSKSDTSLSEHLSSGGEDNQNQQLDQDQMSKTREPFVGYLDMIDNKIAALENIDKLIPRPSKINKDAPLYLCIRMGKYKKKSSSDQTKGSGKQRFSPTYSFGKKKYNREYWFSVPKDKSKNLYYFFDKWAPEVYGDVDDVSQEMIENRNLEPLTTDDEFDDDYNDEDVEMNESSNNRKRSGSGSGRKSSNGGITTSVRSRLRFFGGGSNNSNDDENKFSSSLVSGDENQSTNSAKMNTTQNQNDNFWRRRSPLNFFKLVEGHFSADGLSADWNVSNSSEEHSFAERYQLGSPINEPLMPDIIGHSELLDTEMIQHLVKHLPARAEGYAWHLIYNTSTHGISLNTLYRAMKEFDSPMLLLIEDTNGAKFGALLSHTLRISEHFYGTGETFLFTFHPDFECFLWTGENLFFIKGNSDSISIGAGEGTFGLWIDGDLNHGSSHPCQTFGNRTLSSQEDFMIRTIECWGFA